MTLEGRVVEVVRAGAAVVRAMAAVATAGAEAARVGGVVVTVGVEAVWAMAAVGGAVKEVEMDWVVAKHAMLSVSQCRRGCRNAVSQCARLILSALRTPRF